jgi:uncharacterized caspase-like protein
LAALAILAALATQAALAQEASQTQQASQALLAMQASPPPPVSTAPKARRLALLVGVGKFVDPAFTKLIYAHNDVKAVHQWLTSPKGGGFSQADVRVLLDEQATRAAIMREAEAIAAQAQPEDLVLLYFSTHGFFTPDQVVGIVCHDTRATGQLDAYGSPIVFRSQSLTRDDLYVYLRRLSARRQAVIVDVCHGGQLAGESSSSRPSAEARAAAEETSDKPREEGAAEVADDPEKTTLVLASCLGSERAWESQELESSIFTHYILRGLKESDGDLVAAFDSAREETERQARCEKGFCQTPYLVRQPPGRGFSLAPPREG